MLYMKNWAVSSAGEHHVDIVGVTGSIPVRSTINFLVIMIKMRELKTYYLSLCPSLYKLLYFRYLSYSTWYLSPSIDNLLFHSINS